ncbi:hypothetical protein [Priestia endophytica]|jgi:hypothetical protein|uniref:hypothetical protein n=1 Tax=Priestia endophytica TaxID=135735 RepID=UPI000FC13780|nr:hypothetical protein [Priestia endophytica]MED4074152.1 hypothetical protein [Priestia endophytica]RPK10877.1 hypothetical protein FH5_03955 [Priestia endophytica]
MIRISLNKGLDYVFEKGIRWGEAEEMKFGRIPGYIPTTHAMVAVEFLQKEYEYKEMSL